MKSTAFFLAACALVASACNPSTPGSCSITASGAAIGSAVIRCTDYGEAYSPNAAMSQCVAPAVYSNTSCTTINRLGHCTVMTPVGTATSSITISYYPITVTLDGGADGGTTTGTLTVDGAMAMCTALADPTSGTTATFVAN